MNEKKRTTENYDHWEIQDTYRTGSTQPPKNHGGLIAFLLGLVIFLCGISTALGLMNIRLFQALNDQSAEITNPVAFSRSCDESFAPVQVSPDYFPVGFSGHEVSEFWTLYDALPRGIYITEVCEKAAGSGIAPGDILLWANDTRVTDGAELMQVLSAFRSGDSINAIIYRDGQQLSFHLTVD